MAIKFNARSWHNWISFALVIPILIVSVTAVFIAHNKRLGLNAVDVTGVVGWLPGYGAAAMKREAAEVRASLTTADGAQWLGTRGGLYRFEAGIMQPVAALAGIEVRDLAAAPWGTIAATKNGIWIEQQGRWRLVHGGDAWSAGGGSDGMLTVAVKEQGLLTSRDGTTWRADTDIGRALAALPAAAMGPERITLNKLVMDLHTGKALLGKQAEWVWIDLVGLVMTFLGITGVYLWWRGERRKRELAG